MNSSESCWVPKGWNSGLEFKNIATNIFGLTSFKSKSLIALLRLVASILFGVFCWIMKILLEFGPNCSKDLWIEVHFSTFAIQHSYSKYFRCWQIRNVLLRYVLLPFSTRQRFVQFVLIIFLILYPSRSVEIHLELTLRKLDPELFQFYLDHLGLVEKLEVFRWNVRNSKNLGLEIFESFLCSMFDLSYVFADL